MKKLFKFQKLTILILTIILAYILFRNSSINYFISSLGNLKLLGTFVAGIFFAFGFTAPFAVGYFIVSNPSNVLFLGIIGGLGALLSDLFIFKIIRISFMDEFRELKKNKFFKEGYYLLNKIIHEKIKIYLICILAGILIASPLHDEVGVTLLAGLTKIKTHFLAVISFILNTIGIIILLLI